MKLVALQLALFAGAAAAHDLYLMPETFRVSGQQVATVGIHNGDAFPESQQTPPMERLRDAMAHTTKGAVRLQGPRADGKRAVLNVPVTGPGHVLVTVVAAANVFSMKPDEFLEYLNEEALTHVIDWRKSHDESGKDARERYTKFAKTILLAGDGNGGYAKPAGLPIEFIPESDPFQMKPGGSLNVKVLFKGAPAAGLMVAAASTKDPKAHPIGRTSADGRIAIPIDAAGKWRLHTVLMEPLADRSVADWESFWATLTFEIP